MSTESRPHPSSPIWKSSSRPRSILSCISMLLSDDVVGDVATACNEVSAGPQMPPPELTGQGSIFTEQFAGTPTLKALQQGRYRHVRRYRSKDMHMGSLET